MKMLSSSPAPDSGEAAASRRRSGSVARMCLSVSPASRSFSTTATWATASRAICDETSTKIVRTTQMAREAVAQVAVVHRLARHLRRDLHEDRAHYAALQRQHQQQPVPGHLQQLEPLEH